MTLRAIALPGFGSYVGTGDASEPAGMADSAVRPGGVRRADGEQGGAAQLVAGTHVESGEGADPRDWSDWREL